MRFHVDNKIPYKIYKTIVNPTMTHGPQALNDGR